MELQEKIKSIVEGKLENTGLFLVDISASENTRKIVVYIDGDEGVTINDITSLSRQLSRELDETDPVSHSYILEVSSPGVTRPLKLNRQYKKNVGKNLSVTTIQGEEYSGRLVYVDEEKLIVQQEKGKESEDVTLTFDKIKEAKVII